VARDRETAVAALHDCLIGGAFGAAGSTVVVEELLDGPEVSVFVVSDGTGSCVLLDAVQDHKRVGDGDTGPNTGGMGAYSPVPIVDRHLGTLVLDTVMAQVIDELQPFHGVLFAGLMLTADGPRVLEFNCRFGDPETEVLLPRMPRGLGTLLRSCADGTLAEHADNAGFDDGAAVSVVLASEGYPGSYPTGVPIEGVDAAAALEGVTVFHAGTARDADGRLITAGGRVLAVTGTGASLREARERAYAGVSEIRFEGMHYRTDIAARAAEEER